MSGAGSATLTALRPPWGSLASAQQPRRRGGHRGFAGHRCVPKSDASEPNEGHHPCSRRRTHMPIPRHLPCRHHRRRRGDSANVWICCGRRADLPMSVTDGTGDRACCMSERRMRPRRHPDRGSEPSERPSISRHPRCLRGPSRRRTLGANARRVRRPGLRKARHCGSSR